LKTLLKHPIPTPQQESDIRHLAMCAASIAEVFLTRDTELLDHAADIGEAYGIQVMRPVELISRFSETEHAALYQPARFASTDIQRFRPRPDDLGVLVESLHAPSHRESRKQFEAKLRELLCDVGNPVLAAAV